MRLSIVVPTYRRPDALPRTLDALEAQSVSDFEVVVVDDATDDDPEVVASSIGSRPFPVKHLHRHAPGVSAARNDGWRAAESRVVMFLGDDILAAPDLVERHLDWHENEHPQDEIGVLGHVEWAREIKRSAFMIWLDDGIQFDYGTLKDTEAGPGYFYTSNISLKRVMLERVGGFDEERFPFLYEDIDLGLRLKDIGFRLLYNRDARAEHLHEPKLEDWQRRMAATAKAEKRFIERHPGEQAYFHDLLSKWLHVPDAGGRRGRALLPYVPRWIPIAGKKVWHNADLYYRQQLGRPFMEGWEGG